VAEQLGVPAFVVGGLVRDLLLGRKNFGVDVVIDGDGITFSRALSLGWVLESQRAGGAVKL
jgi:tRNA nucleotidyltransferase (CCA-adding enzyme)